MTGVMGVDVAPGEPGVDPVPEGLRVTFAPAAGLAIVEKVGWASPETKEVGSR